jgi:hypothetical protein
MNRPFHLLAATATLLALGTGCEEIEPFLPTVAFQALEPEEITFERAKVDFVFAVDNPNPVEVDLSSFSYALGLEDVPLLDGDNEDGFTLEASNASELRLPVDLTWQGVFETINATRGEDFVDFGLKGHFGFDTPVGEARLPYDEGGDFPALRTPKFRFKNLRATNLDIFTQTASLELDLGVDHEQAATMFFDSFDYGVTLGGRPLASGLVNTFSVESQQEGGLTLPIQVNLLTAGATIVSAITGGGPIDIGLAAAMDVDTPFGIVPLAIDQTGNLNIDL